LKGLKVEVKVILKRVLVLFLLNLCLKLIASEEKMRKISVLGIKISLVRGR